MLPPFPSRRRAPSETPQQRLPDRAAELRAQLDGKASGAPARTGTFANVDTSMAQDFGRGGRGSFANRPRDPRQPAPTVGAGPQTPTVTSPADARAQQAAEAAAKDAAKQKAADATREWQRFHPGQAYSPPSVIDQDEEDFVRSLLEGAGNVDTSDEEQAIRDASDRLMGRNLVDARARGGRFGAMGAQGAIEGDIRNQAAQQESQQIIDARTKAQQQAIDNALKGIGADEGLRSAGEDAAIFDMIMDILDNPPPASGSDDGGGGLLDTLNKNLNDPHTALRPNGRQPLPAGFDRSQAVDGGLVLGGIAGLDQYLGSDDKYDYYRGSDGKVHKERRQS